MFSCDWIMSKQGKALSNDVRQLIVNAVEDRNMSVATADDVYQTSRSSVYNYLKLNRKNGTPNAGKQGSRRESLVKFTPEMEEYVIRIVSRNPMITLKNIEILIYKKFKVNINITTINNSLKGHLFTVKNVIKEPTIRNATETKKLWKIYKRYKTIYK